MTKKSLGLVVNSHTLLFSLSLCGYVLASSLVNGSENSRIITVPYRAIVVFLSVFAVVNQSYFEVPKNKTHIVSGKDYHPLIKSLLFFFLSIYSFRLVSDLLLKTDLYKPKEEYILSWFFIAILPSIACRHIYTARAAQYFQFCFYTLYIAFLFILPSIIFKKLDFTLNTGRSATEALNAIGLGHYGGSLFLLCMYFLFKSDAHVKKLSIQYLILLSGCMIGIYAVLMAGSRGPIISILFPLVFLIMGRTHRRKKTKLSDFLILLLVVFGLMFFAQVATDSGSAVFDRMSSLVSGGEFENLDQSRVPIYEKTISLILDNMALGYGIELPDNLGYPHNLILESFLSTGLFGGFAFILIYIFSLLKSISIVLKDEEYRGWIGMLFIQYAIGSNFSGSLYGNHYFWQLLFVVIYFESNEHWYSKHLLAD
jgi:O-antigen ligase